MNEGAARRYREDFERKLAGLGQAEKQQRRRANPIRYEDTLREYRAGRHRIHKLCIWGSRNQLEGLLDGAGSFAVPAQRLEWDGLSYVELLPRGCGKGEAIRQWCWKKQVRLSCTMSFGDGRNDMDMLQATGISVAMSDGDEELKAAADSVCGTAMEDGIYRELIQRRII